MTKTCLDNLEGKFVNVQIYDEENIGDMMLTKFHYNTDNNYIILSMLDCANIKIPYSEIVCCLSNCQGVYFKLNNRDIVITEAPYNNISRHIHIQNVIDNFNEKEVCYIWRDTMFVSSFATENVQKGTMQINDNDKEIVVYINNIKMYTITKEDITDCWLSPDGWTHIKVESNKDEYYPSIKFLSIKTYDNPFRG